MIRALITRILPPAVDPAEARRIAACKRLEEMVAANRQAPCTKSYAQHRAAQKGRAR